MASRNPKFDTTPAHPIEDKVKLLLGIKGYEDLRFKYCSDGECYRTDIGKQLIGMILCMCKRIVMLGLL